ncbi:hypothetical protein XENTR_v10024111 [Xenopus tropicalis]|nr:hypothetical protein XENTR_v10024111 [Xenopus tropicalis]
MEGAHNSLLRTLFKDDIFQTSLTIRITENSKKYVLEQKYDFLIHDARSAKCHEQEKKPSQVANFCKNISIT